MSVVFEQIRNQANIFDFLNGTPESVGGGKSRVNPAPCCGHNDCFTVYPDHGWYCFSCGRGGSVIDLLLHTNQAQTPMEAAEFLADRYGIEFKRDEATRQNIERTHHRQEIFDAALRHYVSNLKKSKRLLTYLKKERKRSARLIQSEQYGASLPDNPLHKALGERFTKDHLLDSGLVRERNGKLYDLFSGEKLIYPVLSYGKPVDFFCKDPLVARDQRREYRLPAQYRTGKAFFYGNDSLYDDRIILVEGPEDRNTILEVDDFPVVATQGNVTSDQMDTLKQLCRGNEVLLCLDNDKAGIGYRDKIALHLSGIADVRVIDFPSDFKDIDDYLRSREKPGEAWQDCLDHAEDVILYKIKAMPDLEDMSPKKAERIYQPILKMIAAQESPVVRDDYLKRMAKHLKKSDMFSALRSSVRAIRHEAEERFDDEEMILGDHIARKSLRYIRLTPKGDLKFLTNFVLDIKKLILIDDELHYSVRLQNSTGTWSPEFDLVGDERVNDRKFRAKIAAQGSYYFSGNTGDLSDIWQLEEKNAGIDEVISYHRRFGFIKKDKVWLFGNVLIKNGRLHTMDDDGVMRVDGTGADRNYLPNAQTCMPVALNRYE